MLDSYSALSLLMHAVCCVYMSTGNSCSGRQTGSADHGSIEVRIDAQEARASVEDVRKVACPLFFPYTFPSHRFFGKVVRAQMRSLDGLGKRKVLGTISIKSLAHSTFSSLIRSRYRSIKPASYSFTLLCGTSWWLLYARVQRGHPRPRGARGKGVAWPLLFSFSPPY